MPLPPRSHFILCLALGAASACQAEWFTLNDASDMSGEIIQLNPNSIRALGQTRTIEVRANREGAPRRASNGVMFRSFEGVASIDCVTGAASYESLAFYARANFEGAPIYRRRFAPDETRPVAFGTWRPHYAERVVRAACRIEPTESNAPR